VNRLSLEALQMRERHHWLDRHPGDRVVVLDALTYAGNMANLELAEHRAEFRFVHGNIDDTPLVEQAAARGTARHHRAFRRRIARGPLDRGTRCVHRDQRHRHAFDVEGRAAGLAREKSVPTHRFHHVSTDEVYGSLGPEDAAFTESTPYAPNSPYSASKAASDHLVRAYHHTYGLQTTISNCSNNYGPHQFPEKLIPVMIGATARRQVFARLRRWPQHPRLVARRRSLPRHRGSSQARKDR
jgi:dTDP-glucose 4,6-dehydratase